jgi:tRNA U34 2-thiouridine synthase MnmA/TrmU
LGVKAVLLFSGGLDSILAFKVLAAQVADISGLSFSTPFFSAVKAKTTADQIGLPLTVLDITKEYLKMLHSPRYGYGKNMNPCIDCRILMLKTAGRYMEENGADFLLTGEVLGERPMSQGKQTLVMTAKNAGYPDKVLRPLSARLLPETEPERSGKINRNALLDLHGRGRKRQMVMALHYGIAYYPPPSGGCLLTDVGFSRRLCDLFEHDPDYSIRDIELLKLGRHFRLDEKTKAIIGRDLNDNKLIENIAQPDDALIRMSRFPGPTVLVPHGGDEQTRLLAARLCHRYSDAPRNREASATCLFNGKSSSSTISALPADVLESLLI